MIVGSPTAVASLGFAADNVADLQVTGLAQWSMVCVPIVAQVLPSASLYLFRIGAALPLSAIRFLGSPSVIRHELDAPGPIWVPENRALIVGPAAGLLRKFRRPLDLAAL